MKLLKWARRQIKRNTWHNLKRLSPISSDFGFDRGTPIDRIYIEDFLRKNTEEIRGIACEIAEPTYIEKFGKNISNIEVFHFKKDRNATIVGDLTKVESLPENVLDCFVCTQTLNFIYDVRSAVRGIHRMLKKDGVALVTVAGICQISRHDMNNWGDYWRFTDKSLQMLFEEVFQGEVIVETYGNVLTATSFLHGISVEELNSEEIFFKDQDYQVVITVKAKK